MTHSHLRLDFAGRFKNDTYNDDDGVSAEGECAHLITREDVGDHRNDSDNAEHDRADQDDAVHNLGDVIRGGLAGADTGDEAAVLLEVIRDLDRVEGDCRIEVCERDNQKEGNEGVEPRACTKQVNDLLPERTVLRGEEHSDSCGNRNDGVCKDDRHNARHGQLDRHTAYGRRPS